MSAEHEVTISSFPTTSPFIQAGRLYGSDYSIVCSCGNATTCSYRETAEAITRDHLEDGVPFGREADTAFLTDDGVMSAARAAWDAYAAWNEIDDEFDDLDASSQEEWRHVARAVLAVRTRITPVPSGSGS